MCSMPMDRRTVSGLTPARASSSGESCRWVVDAGCVASERVSPSHARYTIRTQETGWTVCVAENGEEKALPLDGELSIVMED